MPIEIADSRWAQQNLEPQAVPVSASDVREWAELTIGLIDELKKVGEQHRPIPVQNGKRDRLLEVNRGLFTSEGAIDVIWEQVWPRAETRELFNDFNRTGGRGGYLRQQLDAELSRATAQRATQSGSMTKRPLKLMGRHRVHCQELWRVCG
jgi:hypothetical protein